MNKSRIEAFSDGVLAIIITVMVLGLEVPHGDSLADLLPILPRFLSYVLSFIYVGIYWNNHHHLFQAVKSVNGPVLWANSHLLFWLSLLPFTSAFAGENHLSSLPLAIYGFVLFMAAIAYFIVIKALLKISDQNEALKRAIGNDFKGKISVVLYAFSILFSFWIPWLAVSGYVFVAIMWLIPDRRIEKVLSKSE